MSPEHAAMVAYAVSRLNDGRVPGEAFADLVAIGVARHPAAVAVCVAAGTPIAAAEARVRDFDEVIRVLPADNEAAGSILEEHGLFDVEAVLDEAQSMTAAHLRQAIAAAGWFASRETAYRMIRTGRLIETLTFLDDLGAGRWPDNQEFWAHLERARNSIPR